MVPWTRRMLVATVVALVVGCTGSPRPADPTAAAPGSGPSPTPPAAATTPSSPAALRAAVTAQGIRRHLAALQRVADQHGGNRASGTPGFGASMAYVASQLRAAGYQPQIQRFGFRADADSATQSGSNLLAQRPGTRSNRVVMIGAHLDSVPAGPGINDNASGAAVLLELAKQLADARLPVTVRFAWWDGEEPGRFGSSHYVRELGRTERNRIVVYLNLDMVGSPNYTRLVYSGDGDHAPPGSDAVEQLLTDHFRSQGLAVGSLEPGEGSDHAPFAAAGIPIGGLFTGLESKTQREQSAYGGTAGAAADPCYHKACDDLTNINLVALDQMADAAASAVMRLALDPAALERARPSG